MMWKPTSFACLLTLLCALPSFGEEQTHLLQYKFQPNQFAYYDVNHEMSITTRFGETSETAVNESFARKHFRVVSVDASGEAVLELVLDRVQMKARFGEHDPTIYDSGSKEIPPRQFRDVHARIGKPQVRARFASTGELLSVTPLMENVTLNESGSSDLVGQNFLLQFPKDAIKIGDTWKDVYTTEVNLTQQLKQPVRIQRVYKLEAVEGKIARILMKTQVLTPIKDPAQQAQLIQRTPDGTILFDLEKGQLISRELIIDDSVIGPFGPKSAMMAKSNRVEKLLTSEQVAVQPEPLTKQ